MAFAAPCECSDKLRLQSHAPLLALQLDPTESKPFPQNARHLALDLLLLFHIPPEAIRFAGGPSREIDVPHRFVGIAVAVEERTANVLTEDAAVLGRCLVPIEPHLQIIDDVVIYHARSKVAFTMRSHAYDPRAVATVSPDFPCLVEEVDPVQGKMV